MRIIAIRVCILLMLAFLAMPATVLIEGCGSTDYCGGCPGDSIAPDFSTMDIISAIQSETIEISESSALGESRCWSDVGVAVRDEFDVALNGICVEATSNGFLKLAKSPGNCTASSGEYVDGYLRTRTDEGGTLLLDIATAPATCADLGLDSTTNTTKELTFFVQFSSCRMSQLSSVTITYVCVP